MVNGTDVLKWLREILICRNKFLLKNKVRDPGAVCAATTWRHPAKPPPAPFPPQESATMGGGIPICRQAQTKLEVCLYMFLWSPDTEAVLVAMSCFRHLCEEADIRSAADEVPVQTILPNYPTFSELASVSNMMGTGQCRKCLRLAPMFVNVNVSLSGSGCRSLHPAEEGDGPAEEGRAPHARKHRGSVFLLPPVPLLPRVFDPLPVAFVGSDLRLGRRRIRSGTRPPSRF